MPELIVGHHIFKNSSFVDGDVALVKLSQGVKLNRFVRTVCLPEKDEGDLAVPKKSGIVAGWGITRALRLEELSYPNETSQLLRHSAFTIQSDQLCSKKSILNYNSTLTFCAGDGKGRSDTCKGDSGGAFVRQIRRGSNLQWIAIAIVSWGEGCAQKVWILRQGVSIHRLD